MSIAEIDRRRRELGVTVDRLCIIANVSRTAYDEALSGQKVPRHSTLAKLNLALDGVRRGVGAHAVEMAPAAAFRACILVASFWLEPAPETAGRRPIEAARPGALRALRSVPSRRATASPEWRQAATVRRVAVWLANQMFGFRQTDLARAAGVTRQMVSETLKDLEDQRDADPALDQVLTEMEEVFAT